MARVIRAVGPLQIRDPLDDSFAALVRSITYQQLAGAAAAAIHGRFLKLFTDTPSPVAVLALPELAMRSAGLSGSKVAAITDLARKVADGTVPLHDVESLSDDELVERLVQVRGIGRWTAEMFLIFQLRRLDVWPVDDFAVRKGWAIGSAETPRPPGRGRAVSPVPNHRRVVLLARDGHRAPGGLTTVPSAEALDLLVGHRRRAVGGEKIVREALAEVVLQGPDAGGQVLAWIAEAGTAHVDQPAQLSLADQHVREAVVAVNQDMAPFANAIRAICRIGAVNQAHDFAEHSRNLFRRPANGCVVQRNSRHLAGYEPVIAGNVKEADHLRHR